MTERRDAKLAKANDSDAPNVNHRENSTGKLESLILAQSER
jgi:hypothetical protein